MSAISQKKDRISGMRRLCELERSPRRIVKRRQVQRVDKSWIVMGTQLIPLRCDWLCYLILKTEIHGCSTSTSRFSEGGDRRRVILPRQDINLEQNQIVASMQYDTSGPFAVLPLSTKVSLSRDLWRKSTVAPALTTNGRSYI